MTAPQPLFAPYKITCEVCERRHDPATVHGEQIDDIYDGIAIWHAPCGHSWPRFPYGPRRDATERILAERAAP